MNSLFKDLTDYFGRALGVTHGTMSTQISLPAAVQLLQIQFDTASGVTNTSVAIARSGTIFKQVRILGGPGTREVSFAGRAFGIPANSLVMTRPNGDSHTIHWTLVYTTKA